MSNNQETKKQPTFYCYACRTNKHGQAHLIKVAQTDLKYNLVRGQSYSFCSPCSPKIKEFNEYDLLNDNPHLWEKYPYSDAEEILEKEFGIKPKN